MKVEHNTQSLRSSVGKNATENVVNRISDDVARHEQRRYELFRAMLPVVYEFGDPEDLEVVAEAALDCADAALRVYYGKNAAQVTDNLANKMLE